jgi:hypothetical protein
MSSAPSPFNHLYVSCSKILHSLAKMTRLRQAKEEAEREVQQYRTNMETEYQNKLSEARTK